MKKAISKLVNKITDMTSGEMVGIALEQLESIRSKTRSPAQLFTILRIMEIQAQTDYTKFVINNKLAEKGTLKEEAIESNDTRYIG